MAYQEKKNSKRICDFATYYKLLPRSMKKNVHATVDYAHKVKKGFI